MMSRQPKIVEQEYNKHMREEDAKPQMVHEFKAQYRNAKARESALRKLIRFVGKNDIQSLEKGTVANYYEGRFQGRYHYISGQVTVRNMFRVLGELTHKDMLFSSAKPVARTRITRKEFVYNKKKLDRLSKNVVLVLNKIPTKELRKVPKNIVLRDKLIRKLKKVLPGQSAIMIDLELVARAEVLLDIRKISPVRFTSISKVGPIKAPRKRTVSKKRRRTCR